MRYNVFPYALGLNWVIVTIYVRALLVSSLLIFMQLLGPQRSIQSGAEGDDVATAKVLK